ncbi:MAG: N-acetylneuraminate synthase [Spirochaetales bacterium]|jgi:N,N'-diacetyllegionaminate synthase|nr:N-acetylneuraminate synthase [Spirochaetales bacterium]|tara:strand:+ start:610 stop:1620 length:1011 start_codon:yes stop_codon:yes gene_type:complete
MGGKNTKVIAEAGVNHNGELVIAKKLVDAAKKIGADYIKFQLFDTKSLVTKKTNLAQYQKKAFNKDISQFELLKSLELNKNDIIKIINYTKKKKINFLASSFDINSAKFLYNIGIDTFKIPSGEINNIPYLECIGKFKKKIILSTGMSNIKEIKLAIQTLVKFGSKKKDIVVLHCNSEYPSPIEDINMKAMLTIKKECNVEIGYSDHSNNIEVPIAAAALGAKIIEKHLTLDRNMKGPDHKASLNPKKFKIMIDNIKNTEIILGSSKKFPTFSEIRNMKFVRKSIVALKNIKKGEKFSKLNLTIKRPGYGIPPTKYKNILGKKSNRNYLKDELIIK